MYIGIEIGGTKLQVGIGAGAGNLSGLWRETVEVAAGPEGIRRQIQRAIPELLTRTGMERSALKGVGVGFGGPVDDATRTVIKSHQIKGWDGFPLADWIAEIVGVPAVLGNDADVAGLAEALFGAGKGLSPIFYITIGSGIGGGLIINGEILRGCGRGAAEIGHMRVFGVRSMDAQSRDWGTLESFSSGWAIESFVKAELARRYSPSVHFLPASSLGITAERIARAAEERNELAQFALHRAWDMLAEAICQVIALLCPRRIVIGGGVSLMGEGLLFKPLRSLVAQRVFQPFANCFEIVPATLGEEVVVHGAVALARRRLS